MLTLKELKEQTATFTPELKKEAKKIFSLKITELSYLQGKSKENYMNIYAHRSEVVRNIFDLSSLEIYEMPTSKIEKLYRIFWLFSIIKGFDPQV